MYYIFPGLTNGQPYYLKLYTLNPQGRINNRADLPVLTVIPRPFPKQPATEAEYTLITEIHSTQSFSAPEDGWYLIEVHGASGNGGGSGLSSISWYVREDEAGENMLGYKTGGSGAGSSCSASIVKLRSGDRIDLTIGAVGEPTQAVITSTAGETYAPLKVSPGGSGTDASTTDNGSAGIAGTPSGGNLYNIRGGNGKFGGSGFFNDRDSITVAQRAGGAPATPTGASGGASSSITNGIRHPAEPGTPGKVRISRGNTNITV